jgi:hypothetical protein
LLGFESAGRQRRESNRCRQRLQATGAPH